MDLEPLKIDPARRARRPSRRGRWIVLAVSVLVGLWLALGPLRARVEALFLPAVRVEKLRRELPGGVGEVSANGYVVARTRAALSADTPGRVVEMNVVEGSVVREGEVVARLFSDELRAALERARAELELARAGLERARADEATGRSALETLRASARAAAADVGQHEARLVLAGLEFERAVSLLESQVDSARNRDIAKAELEGSRARVEWSRAQHEAALGLLAEGEARLVVLQAAARQAEASLAAAEAALALAEATLEKTNVRAPFDGIVVLKDAEVGEVVSPNVQGGSTARGSVVTMVDFRSLEVQAEVPESSLAAVRQDGPVEVFLDAWPDEVYAGRVSRIWPTANRTKATVEVRVTLERLDERLRPEMGVRIRFLGPDAASGERAELSVAESAVVERDGRRGVFVLEEERARFRALELGAPRGTRRAVVGGLEEGTEVVLEPPARLADGARVRRAEGS